MTKNFTSCTSLTTDKLKRIKSNSLLKLPDSNSFSHRDLIAEYYVDIASDSDKSTFEQSAAIAIVQLSDMQKPIQTPAKASRLELYEKVEEPDKQELERGQSLNREPRFTKSSHTIISASILDQSKTDSEGCQIVIDWNNLALDIASRGSRGPTLSSRLYAWANTALYDSHTIFDPSARGYIYNLPSTDRKARNFRKAIAKAFKDDPLNANGLMSAVMAITAHKVLGNIGKSLFGSNSLPLDLQSRLDSLLSSALSELNAVRQNSKILSPWVNSAINYAIAAGDSILAKAWGDGSNQLSNYIDSTNYRPQVSVFDPSQPRQTLDEHWQPLIGQKALTPHWGNVQSFAGDISLLPTSVLEPYDANQQIDERFIDQVNGVLLSSMNLTPEQKAIAEYWEQGNGTTYPPGKWVELSLDQLNAENDTLGYAVQKMFAISQVVHSAAVLAWDTKYTWDTVRPLTAIRQYYYGHNKLDDGITPLTDWREIQINGQDWRPYLNTPGFPEFVSGHSTFSAAAGFALTRLRGSNLSGTTVTFADSQSRIDPNGFDGLAGEGLPITLKWDYWNEESESAGISRIYGGIHFAEGNLQGQILGYKIGNAVVSRALDLFGNKSSGDLIDQIFGTLEADIITGTTLTTAVSTHGRQRVEQIYGFDGNDLLISGGTDRYELFGGGGRDSFRIVDWDKTWIRDYQKFTDKIEILASGALKDVDIAAVSVLGSLQYGNEYSEIQYLGKTLAVLDGQWNRNDIDIALIN